MRRLNQSAATRKLNMASQRVAVVCEPHSDPFKEKAHLIYKLYLLEIVRNELEEELRDLIHQTYEELRGVLQSSLPTPLFRNVTNALDIKCNKFGKLSALLKDLKTDHQSFDGVSFNYFQPLKALFSHHHLQVSLHPLRPSEQEDDSESSSFNNTTLPGSISCLEKEEKAVFQDKNEEVSINILPAVVHSKVIIEEESNILLPSLKDALSEIHQCNHRSVVIWGHGDDVQVPHQKQTSSQLLRFLKEKAKNNGSLEVTVFACAKSKHMANNSDSPTRPSPTIKTRSDQVEHVVTDERAPETLHTNVHQAPVFRVKRVDEHRSLIYSCVIATETELWDVGDIFTDAFLQDSVHFSTLESEKCQTAFAELDKSEPLTLKPQTLQSTQPGLENCSRDSDRLAAKSVDIPEFEIRTFEESVVVVSHVVSPSDFYIQLADSPKKLEALFTDQAASCSYAEQKCIPDIGAQVICWFPQNEQWCRAQVVRISGVSRNGAGRNPSINVEVKRLDYGDTSCVPLCHIKQLSPEMAVLPLQALQVSLAHVRPVNGRDWTEEAVDWFKAMVHGRTLYARLYPQGLAVSVELFLERGKLGAMRRGASLSQRLAHNGHAKHKLKNNGVVRKSAVQLGKKEQESEWEKYLISCYSQNKK